MLVPALLTLLVVLFRVLMGSWGTSDTAELLWLHNFSPLASVALCGAAFFPRRLAVIFPLGALFVSDLILNAHYGVSLVNLQMLPQYLALGVIVALGLSLRRTPRPGPLLLGSLAGSLLFYVVTNSGAWLWNPEYARTVAGLGQALTTGVSGHASTLLFFRNSAVSDLLFTVLFVWCMGVQPSAEKSVAFAPLTS